METSRIVKVAGWVIEMCNRAVKLEGDIPDYRDVSLTATLETVLAAVPNISSVDLDEPLPDDLTMRVGRVVEELLEVLSVDSESLPEDPVLAEALDAFRRDVLEEFLAVLQSPKELRGPWPGVDQWLLGIIRAALSADAARVGVSAQVDEVCKRWSFLGGGNGEHHDRDVGWLRSMEKRLEALQSAVAVTDSRATALAECATVFEGFGQLLGFLSSWEYKLQERLPIVSSVLDAFVFAVVKRRSSICHAIGHGERCLAWTTQRTALEDLDVAEEARSIGTCPDHNLV